MYNRNLKTYPISIKIRKLLYEIICPIIKQHHSFQTLYENLLKRIQKATYYVQNVTNTFERQLYVDTIKELAFHLMFIYRYNDHNLKMVCPKYYTQLPILRTIP